MTMFGPKKYRLTFAVAVPQAQGQSVQLLATVLPELDTQFVREVTSPEPHWMDLQYYCMDRDCQTWINTRHVVALSEMED